VQAVIVGWREWAALPDLGISRLPAKLDTGAHTCALHAVDIEPMDTTVGAFVRFRLDEGGPTMLHRLHCWRSVRDAGGHCSLRPVIRTELSLAGRTLSVDICLADRSRMKHRLIIGRRVLRRGFAVNCGREHLHAASVPLSAHPAAGLMGGIRFKSDEADLPRLARAGAAGVRR